MGYQWTAAPQVVRFTRGSNRAVLVLLLVVGLVVASVGAWGIGARAELSAFVAIFMQMLGAIGALFVVAAVAGLASGDRYDPYEILFDGAHGRIRVRDKASEVSIPFRDVRGFEVREKRVTTTSTQGSGHTGTVHHFFAVVETEATTFEVLQASSRQDAERAVTAMRGCVAENASGEASASTLPRALVPADDGATTTLRWRNAAARPLVMFVFIASIMAFVISRFAALIMVQMGGEGAIFYVVLGFIALVLLFIVVTNVRKLVRDLRNTYELAVGPFGVKYAEHLASAPGAPPRKTVAAAPGEIVRVLFPHQLEETPQAIRALDAAGAEKFSIDVVALSATERMMLAMWITDRFAPQAPYRQGGV